MNTRVFQKKNTFFKEIKSTTHQSLAWGLVWKDSKGCDVMFVTDLLSVNIDFTDVTLVSDDTYRRLYWSDPDDPGDPDESYLVIKIIQWWNLSGDKSYLDKR